MNSEIDSKSLSFVAIVVAMPFIAAFHTSIGGPWMLTSTLTVLVTGLAIVWGNRDQIQDMDDVGITEKFPEPASPDLVPSGKQPEPPDPA